MSGNSEKKVAIVTGGSSGIGKATVKGLLKEGFQVHALARRTERMKDLEDLGAESGFLDLTETKSLADAVNSVLEKSGRIDVLVNNAGYGSYGTVEDVPLEEARRQFEVNLFGLARITQLVLPVMRSQGSGRIVNISSMGGKIYLPLGAWYHAAKHALEGWSDVLRNDVASFGIKVVIIEPGVIQTEWEGIARESALRFSGDTAYGEMTRNFAEMLENIYGGGKGSPPEVVANTIVKAVRVKRPRTRYPVGVWAKPLLLIRSLLSDRAFDRLIRKVYGI